VFDFDDGQGDTPKGIGSGESYQNAPGAPGRESRLVTHRGLEPPTSGLRLARPASTDASGVHTRPQCLSTAVSTPVSRHLQHGFSCNCSKAAVQRGHSRPQDERRRVHP
jgi:hypothetical protein